MSWDEACANHYETWSANTTADIAFYVELARQANGPLVELAIGNGRVAIPVALATGRPVIGIDTSPAMLALARANATEAGVELDLREGDMRDLTLDQPAGLIYCPFHALLHLPTWAERRRTFERVAASLRPDGRFAWNTLAFDHRIAAQNDGVHLEKPTPHMIRYAVGANRIDIIRDDGAKSSMWWATKNEWLGLLDVAGLEAEAIYGGFAGEPFTDDSTNYVFVARHFDRIAPPKAGRLRSYVEAKNSNTNRLTNSGSSIGNPCDAPDTTSNRASGIARAIASPCSTVVRSCSPRINSVGTVTPASSLNSIRGSVCHIRHTLSTTSCQCPGPSGDTAAYKSFTPCGIMSGIRSCC